MGAAGYGTGKFAFRRDLNLRLPPAWPEINAAENTWQYLRQT